eukprot:8683972-Pyramimonas_sp.AAC.1
MGALGRSRAPLDAPAWISQGGQRAPIYKRIWPQEAPMRAQDGQNGPRALQDAQDGPNTVPEAIERPHERSKKPPKRAPINEYR